MMATLFTNMAMLLLVIPVPVGSFWAAASAHAGTVRAQARSGDVQLRLSPDDIVEVCSTSESAPGAARARPESVRRATLR